MATTTTTTSSSAINSTLLRNRHKANPVVTAAATQGRGSSNMKTGGTSRRFWQTRNKGNELPMFKSSSSSLGGGFSNHQQRERRNGMAKTAIVTILLVVGVCSVLVSSLFSKTNTKLPHNGYQHSTTTAAAANGKALSEEVDKKISTDKNAQPKAENPHHHAARMMTETTKEEKDHEDQQPEKQEEPTKTKPNNPISQSQQHAVGLQQHQEIQEQKVPDKLQHQIQILQPKKKPVVEVKPIPPKDGVYDIAILGAGPAGLSAALFGARAGLSVLVLGSQSGLLSETTLLNNFPSFVDDASDGETEDAAMKEEGSSGGPKWLQLTRQQALSFGANFSPPGILATNIQSKNITIATEKNAEEEPNDGTAKTNSRSVFVLPTQQESYQAYSLIIATGANPRKLDLPNEKELWAKQIHNCAICDGNMYVDKDVVVVGGGDAAIDAALLIARYAKTVTLIHRQTTFTRVKNQFSVNLIEETANINVMTPYVVEEWQTTRSSSTSNSLVLTGAKLKHVDSGDEEDEKHSENLSSVSIDCDGAFLMIGATPNTEWLSSSLSQEGKIELDEEGFIKLSRPSTSTSDIITTTATSIDGIFAAGEVTDKLYRQAITASAEGAQAAMDAERWLRQKHQHRHRQHSSLTSKVKTAAELAAVAAAAAIEKKDVQEVERIEKVVDEKQGDEKRKEDPEADDDCDDLMDEDCITKLVQSHPVVVFSKPWCPYCRKALETLALAGVLEPYVVDLSKYGKQTHDIQATLNQITGRRTVPNVFVNGKTIGGGDETVALHRNEKLIPLLREAGALGSDVPAKEINDEDDREEQKAIEEKEKNDKDQNDGLCDLTTKECVIELTKKYPVLLFTLRGCPECTQMFELLDRLNLGIQPKTIDLNDHPGAAYKNLRKTIGELAGSQSVPSLFVGGESLGGFHKTFSLHDMGSLVPRLERVGAIKADEKDLVKELCDLTTRDCIMQLTKQHPVLLFALKGCPECNRMFEFLGLLKLKIQPYLVELRDYSRRSEEYKNIRQTLKEIVGTQSVPSLFVGGESLGGEFRVRNLHDEGGLVPKFKQVGAL